MGNLGPLFCLPYVGRGCMCLRHCPEAPVVEAWRVERGQRQAFQAQGHGRLLEARTQSKFT